MARTSIISSKPNEISFLVLVNFSTKRQKKTTEVGTKKLMVIVLRIGP
jgi:hypothetical protein